MIADHPRSYDTADVVFDPALPATYRAQDYGLQDQAAPLQGWDLPAPFKTLQRLLEARQGKTGKRESAGPPPCALSWMFCTSPLKTRCEWGPSALMPSSIWCCAGSSGGHHGWIWMSTRSAQHHCRPVVGRVLDGGAPMLAGPSSPAGQSRELTTVGRRGSCALSGPTNRRTRPRTADG